jgi:hypothetical protein
MITNLLATVAVCLVTNSFDVVQTHSEPMAAPKGEENSAVYFFHQVPDANPTNKIIVTEITRITVYSFDFSPQVIREEELISRKEEKFAMKSGWEKVP